MNEFLEMLKLKNELESLISESINELTVSEFVQLQEAGILNEGMLDNAGPMGQTLGRWGNQVERFAIGAKNRFFGSPASRQPQESPEVLAQRQRQRQQEEAQENARKNYKFTPQQIEVCKQKQAQGLGSSMCQYALRSVGIQTGKLAYRPTKGTPRPAQWNPPVAPQVPMQPQPPRGY